MSNHSAGNPVRSTNETIGGNGSAVTEVCKQRARNDCAAAMRPPASGGELPTDFAGA